MAELFEGAQTRTDKEIDEWVHNRFHPKPNALRAALKQLCNEDVYLYDDIDSVLEAFLKVLKILCLDISDVTNLTATSSRNHEIFIHFKVGDFSLTYEYDTPEADDGHKFDCDSIVLQCDEEVIFASENPLGVDQYAVLSEDGKSVLIETFDDELVEIKIPANDLVDLAHDDDVLVNTNEPGFAVTLLLIKQELEGPLVKSCG